MTQDTQTTGKRETQVETVTMTDGRIVDFPGKRRMQKASQVTADGKVQVQLDFRNGQTRLFTIPDSLMVKFAAHGAEQKLGDELAGLKGTDGKEPDVEDCVLTIDELIDRLYNGEWTVRKDGNGLAGTSILIRALAELYAGRKTPEELKDFLKDKSQADKMALRNSAKLKPIVDRLEAEKAAKAGSKVDADALLAGLDAA